jgi:hypothetical protein
MRPYFDTIYIPRNTFGTQLEFTIYDSSDIDEVLSNYTSIVLRAFNPRKEEEFSGSVVETLSGLTASNIVHYLIKDGDLKNIGLYDLSLELIKSTNGTITYKNVAQAGRIKVE